MWRGGYLWYDANEALDKLYEPHAQLPGLKKHRRGMRRHVEAKKKALTKAREEARELLGYVEEQELEYERDTTISAEVLNDRRRAGRRGRARGRNG